MQQQHTTYILVNSYNLCIATKNLVQIIYFVNNKVTQTISLQQYTSENFAQKYNFILKMSENTNGNGVDSSETTTDAFGTNFPR